MYVRVSPGGSEQTWCDHFARRIYIYIYATTEADRKILILPFSLLHQCLNFKSFSQTSPYLENNVIYELNFTQNAEGLKVVQKQYNNFN
jgi:hypothetical protein